MNRLNGKVAIVTGTSSGMGKAVAIKMAQEGAKVVITARRKEKLEETEQTIRNAGGECLALVSDVTKADDWKMIVEKTLTTYGRIDVLVNNAGTGGNPQQGGIGEAYDIDTWKWIFDTNVFGCVQGIHEVLPHLKEQKSGAIINIVSISAICAMGGATAYTTSKSAMLGFTRALARDIAPFGVRANAVLPGIIATEMTEFILDENNEQTKPMLDMWKHKTKLPRFGEGNDIANAVVYLASDESEFVTGAELVVDGGYVID